MSKPIDKKIIQCPCCKSKKLNFDIKNIFCRSCRKKFKQNGNQLIFLYGKSGKITDSLDRVKFIFKRFKGLYDFMTFIVSPVYLNTLWEVKKFVKKYTKGANKVVLNIGSGNTDISAKITNVDVFAYDNVDIVCDIKSLPIRDSSVDAIIFVAVLEHISDPKRVLREICRVLKEKGYLYICTPFIQGFHASPYDFTRFTNEGIKNLLTDYKLLEHKLDGGPASGFLWISQEWLAMILSLGIKPLYSFWYLVLLVILFPIKFLDIFLGKFNMAKNISAGFIYVAQKK